MRKINQQPGPTKVIQLTNNAPNGVTGISNVGET